MKIQILVDNPRSWIVPYAQKLVDTLGEHHDAGLITDHADIVRGDVLVMLSCERKLKDLTLHRYNLVVHESDLPKGKGWSPLTWLVVEGHNRIPVTLIEAADKIDSGNIYGQRWLELDGTELIDELREKQGQATIDLILEFVARYPNVDGKEQMGEETFYRRRGADDSRLDPSKSLEEQFNLLRVVDNDRYPAFFELNGHRYIIRINKS